MIQAFPPSLSCQKKSRLSIKVSRLCCIGITSFLFAFSAAWATAGICPREGMALCKKSLEGAVNTLLDCPTSEQDTKECARVFVATLSEVDDGAPFFEGMYDKEIHLGDQQNYREVIEEMKQDDQDPEALIALYEFTKAVILEHSDFNTLTPDQLKHLSDLVSPLFQDREFRPLEQSEAHHREDFIRHYKERARAIIWPDTPTGRETKRILE